MSLQDDHAVAQNSEETSYLSDQFLDRVRCSYRLSLRTDAVPNDSMWAQIGALQTSVHEALLAPDNERLRAAFVDPSTTDLYYGVDNFARSIVEPLATRSDFDELITGTGEDVRRSILRLSEALGLRRWLPLDYEHASSYYPDGHEVAPDVDGLLSIIGKFIGFEIYFPNPFVGELGLKTSRGLASYRAIQAIYQTHRITQELKGTHNTNRPRT